MNQNEFFALLKTRFRDVLDQYELTSEEIRIVSKALSPEQAIGITQRRDYPILAGKEIMLEAEYKGGKGQAFTDAPAVFNGSLAEILDLDLEKDLHSRGLFIAAMNAVMKTLGLAEKTVHCKNQEPEDCAVQAAAFIKEDYGSPKIALVGYQPALLERLSQDFSLRVLDLNPENVGQMRHGIKIEHGMDDFEDVVKNWAELVLCTGSTLCNGTIVNFLDLDKEVLFFGTTLAGAAKLMGCKRMCFCAV